MGVLSLCLLEQRTNLKSIQAVIYGLCSLGRGDCQRRESEIWEYCLTETSLCLIFFLPFSFLFLFLFFFAHHVPFESQLISSFVALMRQPDRGDIYIRR